MRNDSILHVVVGRCRCASVFVFAVASHSEGAHRFASINRFGLRSSTSLAHKACLCRLTFSQFVVATDIFRSMLPFHSRPYTPLTIEVYLFGFVFVGIFGRGAVSTALNQDMSSWHYLCIHWPTRRYIVHCGNTHFIWSDIMYGRHAIAQRANDDDDNIAFGKTWLETALVSRPARSFSTTYGFCSLRTHCTKPIVPRGRCRRRCHCCCCLFASVRCGCRVTVDNVVSQATDDTIDDDSLYS